MSVLILDVLYRKNGEQYVSALCHCGKIYEPKLSHVFKNESKSCGCYRFGGVGKIKHGESRVNKRTSEYITWKSMKTRCFNKNADSYPRYGGRGITVCDRWLKSFTNFLSDMGRKPGPNYSLDRINNDMNYEPDNCRWATWSEQASNRPKSIIRSGKKTSSAYRCVKWSGDKNKWTASITINKRLFLLGNFETEEEAKNSVKKFVSRSGVIVHGV